MLLGAINVCLNIGNVSQANIRDMSNFYPLEVVGRGSETQLQFFIII